MTRHITKVHHHNRFDQTRKIHGNNQWRTDIQGTTIKLWFSYYKLIPQRLPHSLRLSNLFIRELIFGWISKHKFIGQLLQTSLQVVYVLCMYTKTRVNFPKISSLISSENKSCLKVALQFKGNFFTLFVLQLSFCHLGKICFC